MYKLYIVTWYFSKNGYTFHNVNIESYKTIDDAYKALKEHDEIVAGVYETHIEHGQAILIDKDADRIRKIMTFTVLKRNGLEA